MAHRGSLGSLNEADGRQVESRISAVVGQIGTVKAGPSREPDQHGRGRPTDVPAGGDAYLLRRILHGLTDEQAVLVFERLRAAFGPDTHLLVLDHMVPDGPGGRGSGRRNGPHPSPLDLQMLVGSGGRERSATEMGALFAANGFRLVEVRRTAGPTAVFVGRLATG